MTRFSIGDKVVHPIHGPGLITGVKHQELVEGFEHYYVLEIADRGLTVFVPMRKVHDLRVRPAASRTELTHILDVLNSKPQRLLENHRERQGRIQERLMSGSLVQVAEVVRDLAWRERCDHLTRADSRLLDHGRDCLAAEIALVTDTAVDDAQEAIDAALARGVTDYAHEEGRGQTSAASGQTADATGQKWDLPSTIRHHTIDALRLRLN
jgi:CarD family transcriptional regulator